MATTNNFSFAPNDHANCHLDLEDEEARRQAHLMGNLELVAKIDADMEERHAVCLGSVCVRGEVECGTQHGLVSENGLVASLTEATTDGR